MYDFFLIEVQQECDVYLIILSNRGFLSSLNIFRELGNYRKYSSKTKQADGRNESFYFTAAAPEEVAWTILSRQQLGRFSIGRS
jgi:hypothetical protein